MPRTIIDIEHSQSKTLWNSASDSSSKKRILHRLSEHINIVISDSTCKHPSISNRFIHLTVTYKGAKHQEKLHKYHSSMSTACSMSSPDMFRRVINNSFQSIDHDISCVVILFFGAVAHRSSCATKRQQKSAINSFSREKFRGI